MKLEWLSWSFFRFTSPNGKVILTNPFMAGNPDAKVTLADITRADLILVPNGHGDEIGQTVDIAKKTGAKTVSPWVLSQWFVGKGLPEAQVIRRNPGSRLVWEGITIRVLGSVHGSGSGLGTDSDFAPIYGGVASSFMTTFENGWTVYFTGSSAATRDMAHWGSIAIPVFPSKSFRHASIYINTRSGIREPRNLQGKRVGGPEFSQTAAVWVRGILQDEHGVDLTQVNWFRGGLEAPDPVERVELNLPPTIQLREIPAGKTLNGMLDAGELDAVISPQPPPSSFVRGSPNVARLFPNYREVEMAYYKKTGHFPLARYSFEQGLTHKLANVDEVFAREAVEMFIAASRHGEPPPVGPLRYIER